MTFFTIRPQGGSPFIVTINCCSRWALERLITTRAGGCTPTTEPAPRWSAFVQKLCKVSVAIEAKRELHGGAYNGHYRRYFLRSHVENRGAGNE